MGCDGVWVWWKECGWDGGSMGVMECGGVMEGVWV